MSIEQTLERIAVACEEIQRTLQQNVNPVISSAATVANSQPGPTPAAFGQSTQAIAAQGAPTGGPPQLAAVPAPMPGPSGTGPGQAMPQAAPAPIAPAAAAPAVDTGLLDQIRDAANNFHRAHPERAGEVWQVLSAVGAQKIDAIPAQSQAQVLQQLQALGA